MKNKKLYGQQAVMEYMQKLDPETYIDVIEGCLLDTYIIYHAPDLIEVLEEAYVNCWQSAYIRHIYRKGLPQRFEKAIEEQEECML